MVGRHAPPPKPASVVPLVRAIEQYSSRCPRAGRFVRNEALRECGPGWHADETRRGGSLTAACTGWREVIICNRSMALRVGAEKLTRLSPKFIDFPISRSIRKRSSSGHLVNSFPQYNRQQEASCFGGYKYFALFALPLPSLFAPSLSPSLPLL